MKLKAENNHADEIALSKAQLETALKKVAAELAAKKQDIIIITVGGAVNTVSGFQVYLLHTVGHLLYPPREASSGHSAVYPRC